MNISNALPLDYAFNPQACAFYEGYFVAIQNMGLFLVKIGLIFVCLDIFTNIARGLIKKHFKDKK